MSETEFPLPPPSFEFLVFSLKMQAEMRLGLIGLGEEKQDEPDCGRCDGWAIISPCRFPSRAFPRTR